MIDMQLLIVAISSSNFYFQIKDKLLNFAKFGINGNGFKIKKDIKC